MSGVGITPAWAGKSAGFQSAPSGQRDHPRVGGEKAVWLCAGPRPHGSPPRGRGKAPGPLALRISSRITPAWAGKSKRPAFPVCVMWDHPRVGGEKPEWTSLEEIERGSPPRGRGKAGRRRIGGQAVWITPAWAGKSLTIPKLTTRSWDHPRVGGEKFFFGRMEL